MENGCSDFDREKWEKSMETWILEMWNKYTRSYTRIRWNSSWEIKMVLEMFKDDEGWFKSTSKEVALDIFLLFRARDKRCRTTIWEEKKVFTSEWIQNENLTKTSPENIIYYYHHHIPSPESMYIISYLESFESTCWSYTPPCSKRKVL